MIDVLTSDQVVSDKLVRALHRQCKDAAADSDTRDHKTLTLYSGARLYRVASAKAAYSYAVSGLSRVSNRDGWTELGNGFYTSPDREGAEAYSGTVGKPAVLLELTLDCDAEGKLFGRTSEVDGKPEQAIKEAHDDPDFIAGAALSQIKFHNPFHVEHPRIVEAGELVPLAAWTVEMKEIDAAIKQLTGAEHEQASAKATLARYGV